MFFCLSQYSISEDLANIKKSLSKVYWGYFTSTVINSVFGNPNSNVENRLKQLIHPVCVACLYANYGGDLIIHSIWQDNSFIVSNNGM